MGHWPRLGIKRELYSVWRTIAYLIIELGSGEIPLPFYHLAIPLDLLTSTAWLAATGRDTAAHVHILREKNRSLEIVDIKRRIIIIHVQPLEKLSVVVKGTI